MSEQTLKDIVNYGTYYNPASNHYNNGGTVTCDRCKKTDLDICIGWEKYDLCLPCVEKVKNNMNKPVSDNTPRIMMMQSQFATRMEQEQFRTKMQQNQFATFMQQNQFNEKKDDDDECKIN